MLPDLNELAHNTDFYKTGHYKQYPDGTEIVYSNLTCRSDKRANFGANWDKKVVFFGLQATLMKLLSGVVDAKDSKVAEEYRAFCDATLGPGAVSGDHWKALQELGYIPLEVRALPEGTLTPIGVPMFTMWNTHKDFAWLTNYLETPISATIWKMIQNATMARSYRVLLDRYCELTGGNPDGVKFQGHDFSFRGMSGIEDARMSGMGHLLSFVGTDTIPAILAAGKYYRANHFKELVGCSVPATEHSVMCAGGDEHEDDTIDRIIFKVVPEGIVSVVSDTWDFFRVVTKYVKSRKEKIMARKGKLVIRPDSGDPVKIICGDPEGKTEEERKGAMQCLWEVFGGTTNAKGYNELHPCIGLIYGDSITIERAEAILNRLAANGFASSNIVFGIGSFTYNYCTRDNLGMAIKSTWVQINGEGREIFKRPKTDDGTKFSAKGLIRIVRTNGVLQIVPASNLHDSGLLRTVFKNGTFFNQETFAEIRARLVAENEQK